MAGRRKKAGKKRNMSGEKRQRGKRIIWIRRICLLYVIFFAACCMIPPLIHKRAEGETAVYKEMEPGGKERILCIDDNGEALLWRLRVIEEAKEEVVLSSFDFRADNSGQDMMAALYDAAKRGVKVKIIVDGIPGTFFLRGNRTFRALAAYPGVEVKLYNPINLLTPWKINYRMHDKYVIADDKVFILGGRNTNDLFLGDYREKQNIDRDILVFQETSGGAMEQLRDYFEKVWNLPCSKSLEYTAKKHGEETERLKERFEGLKERFPDAFLPVDWRAETAETGGVLLLTNQTEAENKRPELWSGLSRIMENGEDIFVETPYMICDAGMYRDITALNDGERKLRILLNAPEGGANPFGCADYLNQKQKILGTGSDIYEWNGGRSLHTKTFLIDDRISVVGSYNLDIRSTYLDTEMMLVIDSPELNGILREEIQEKMEKSRHILSDGAEDSGNETGRTGQSVWGAVRSGALRKLIPLFRHLF